MAAQRTADHGVNPELQAIVLAGGRATKLHPLSEEIPKALLPIANRAMITYPLEMLEQAGFKEAIVVVQTENADKMKSFFNEFSGKINVKVEIVNAMTGTCDALRELAPKIVRDFLVVSCDLVSDVILNQLADLHRLHDATLTMLLKRTAPVVGKGKTESKPTIVGVDPDSSRVLHYVDGGNVSETLNIRKSMLAKFPACNLQTNLSDVHLYILKRWVLELLELRPSLRSIQRDLIPYLIKKQYRRQLHASQDESGGLPDGAFVDRYAMPNAMSSGASGGHDRVRCYVHIADTASLCMRANTTVNYLELNREVVRVATLSATPAAATIAAPAAAVEPPKVVTPRGAVRNVFMPSEPFVAAGFFVHATTKLPPKLIVSAECLIGAGVKIGENCVLKKSIIGAHCKVGAKCKLNNCIIMHHAQIDDGAVLNNAVVCPNAHINAQATVLNSQIGPGINVAANADIKGEQLFNDRDERA